MDFHLAISLAPVASVGECTKLAISRFIDEKLCDLKT
jgi:hypothetical protein